MNAPRRIKRPVHGVLLLDKPGGTSSNGALLRVRALYQAAKAGHTGTLDPMATGLLPVAFGEATKFCSLLLDADKTYEAEILLGVHTASGDADGEVLTEREVPVLERSVLEAALQAFRGEIEQLPPMYSALKKDGRALYEYAREGVEVTRTPRRVYIHALEVLSFEVPRVRVRVHCSKGTYIRSLAMDIGAVLGCGAHLSALRRTATGGFDVMDAYSLERIEAMTPAERGACLLPVDSFLQGFERVDLDRAAAQALVQGRRLRFNGPAGMLRIYGPAGFIGVGESVAEVLHPRRLLADAAGALSHAGGF